MVIVSDVGMREGENFTMVGDHRDLPMSLGLIVMTWNACEDSLRDTLRVIAARGDPAHFAAVEVMVSELNSVGISQALDCYALEFPPEEALLAESVAHAAKVLDAARGYRNYYIHGISGVTEYGIDFSWETVEKDIPLHEAITMGPFARVHSKTAKRKRKFSMDFINVAKLIDFNNYLASYYEYLHGLSVAVYHYFREDIAAEDRSRPPIPLPVLDALKKPEFDHPKLKQRPALGRYAPALEDDDLDD